MIEYDIILINKVSKEEYVIALLDEDFDELLKDMEEELMSTQINYYFCKRYSFFIPQYAWTNPYSYTFKI